VIISFLNMHSLEEAHGLSSLGYGWKVHEQ